VYTQDEREREREREQGKNGREADGGNDANLPGGKEDEICEQHNTAEHRSKKWREDGRDGEKWNEKMRESERERERERERESVCVSLCVNVFTQKQKGTCKKVGETSSKCYLTEKLMNRPIKTISVVVPFAYVWDYAHESMSMFV